MDKIPLFIALAPFALLFSQARAYLAKLFSFLWKTIPIDSTVACRHLFKVLYQYPHFDFNQVRINVYNLFNKDTGKKEYKILKDPRFVVILYKYFIPIILLPSKGIYTISFLNYSVNLKKLLANIKFSEIPDGFSICPIQGRRFERSNGVIASSREFTYDNNFLADSPKSYVFESLNPILFDNVKFIDGMICSNYREYKDTTKPFVFNETSKLVYNDVVKWVESESWYTSKGIRYFRGHLLFGQPGTGKSSLVQEICRLQNLPLYIIDLASFENDDFNRIPIEHKSVILIEDIDCIFDKRENITKIENSLGITFDALINSISGVNSVKNKYLFITTNNIDKVDAALLRAGRCDTKTEICSLDLKGKRDYISKILEADFEEILQEGKSDSNAEFENRVVSEALKRYWEVDNVA